jgi:hypothetical protein
MDWSLLARTDVDIMSFDAYFYGEKLGLFPKEVDAHLAKGGYLAWGIVPTAGHTAEDVPVNDETVDSLAKKLDELVALFAGKGVDENRLREKMILTPSCGMGTLTPESTAKVLELLAGLRDTLR